jgi:hypothetical protein
LYAVPKTISSTSAPAQGGLEAGSTCTGMHANYLSSGGHGAL